MSALHAFLNEVTPGKIVICTWMVTGWCWMVDGDGAGWRMAHGGRWKVDGWRIVDGGQFAFFWWMVLDVGWAQPCDKDKFAAQLYSAWRRFCFARFPNLNAAWLLSCFFTVSFLPKSYCYMANAVFFVSLFNRNWLPLGCSRFRAHFCPTLALHSSAAFVLVAFARNLLTISLLSFFYLFLTEPCCCLTVEFFFCSFSPDAFCALGFRSFCVRFLPETS